MQPLPQKPIGLLLAQKSKLIGAAFNDALADAGGSLPVWVILLSLIKGDHHAQTELAASVGVQGPTLTHHLNAMERDGLLTRERNPENRRVHIVALTPLGRDAFERYREIVVAFDKRLRDGLTTEEQQTLRSVLHRMAENVAPGADSGPHECCPTPDKP